MGDAIARMDFVMSGVIRVAYYRSLHIVSVPFGPKDVVKYIRENEAGEGGTFGGFGGHLSPVRVGPIFSVWQWKHVRVGEGLFMDLWIYGFNRGAQTVLTRTAFWELNFGQRTLEVLTPTSVAEWEGHSDLGSF